MVDTGKKKEPPGNWLVSRSIMRENEHSELTAETGSSTLGKGIGCHPAASFKRPIVLTCSDSAHNYLGVCP